MKASTVVLGLATLLATTAPVRAGPFTGQGFTIDCPPYMQMGGVQTNPGFAWLARYHASTMRVDRLECPFGSTALQTATSPHQLPAGSFYYGETDGKPPFMEKQEVGKLDGKPCLVQWYTFNNNQNHKLYARTETLVVGNVVWSVTVLDMQEAWRGCIPVEAFYRSFRVTQTASTPGTSPPPVARPTFAPPPSPPPTSGSDTQVP